MPFEQILARLASHRGVEGVALIDSEGETIFFRGKAESDRLKLIGAYQGIVLSAMQRSGLGSDMTVITLAEEKSVVTHHLVDGYFVSVILAPEVHYASARIYLQRFYDLLQQELS